MGESGTLGSLLGLFLEATDQGIRLHVPPAQTGLDWPVLWPLVEQCLQWTTPWWPPDTLVELLAQDRLLDSRHLHDLATLLRGRGLILARVITDRRQTAVAAATAGYSVEQPLPPQATWSNGRPAGAPPLYIRHTVRSGAEVNHPGTVVVWGDVNPGGRIVAQGDIFIWGHLRGVAHAGCTGDSQRFILALRMDPTQLRIASHVARPPTNPAPDACPEVAYQAAGQIQIVPAWDFVKSHPGGYAE